MFKISYSLKFLNNALFVSVHLLPLLNDKFITITLEH